MRADLAAEARIMKKDGGVVVDQNKGTKLTKLATTTCKIRNSIRLLTKRKQKH